MKINKVKITAIFVVVLTIVSTFGLVINSKAGDEELSYGYFGQNSYIYDRARIHGISNYKGDAKGGQQWRADCVAMQGEKVGPVDRESTQWWHARNLDTNILGYTPRAFTTTTKLATMLWMYDGITCKRGGGPEN